MAGKNSHSAGVQLFYEHVSNSALPMDMTHQHVQRDQLEDERTDKD